MRQTWLLFAVILAATGTASTTAPRLEQQANEYSAEAPKTILELQQFRQSNSIPVAAKDGRQGMATLIDLNPQIGAWYVLKVAWAGRPEAAYHLENPKPKAQKLMLDAGGLFLVAGKRRIPCDVFTSDSLALARSSGPVFAPVCEGLMYLRNRASGSRTTLEAATEFVRDRVWGGEKIIEFGHVLTGDTHREAGALGNKVPAAAPGRDVPLDALVDSSFRERSLTSNNLGLDLGGAERKGMHPGAWYPASGNPGVFASIIQPDLIDPAILQSYKKTVNNLDHVESGALCYLIAFDLEQFDLGFALGTSYPGVVWSERVPERMRDAKLAGPDGIGNIVPLLSTGLLNPENARTTVAAFTGGFKRTHGAFKYGELSQKNHGSHYGFIESGVVFSKLQPGLATVFTLDDGSVQMKTWNEADNQLLARVKFARQNGVALVEFDEAARATVPGALVSRWGPGNWSGSQDAKLRTIRSAAALQKSNGKRFLIYAVFSDATPSAMARVFQAYRSEYAMLLDMNALEHTYCALYRRSASRMAIDHLIKGMSQVDKKSPSGQPLPRFLAVPDNRDFFYVMRREEAKR